MKNINLNNARYSRWLLQLGLAAVFLYAAINSIMHPANWTAYLPTFLGTAIPPDTLVKIFAVYELVLTVWVLSGKYLKLAGLLYALTFAAILLINPHQFIVTFRDVGLLFMALALVFYPSEA
ncbi:MAG TPA: hypothetical protein VFW90_02790 [Candidatus Saccharimonadales bacterium]|nr:hypothetical protein [Candidatus Saccharimonadales bacterium]